MVDTLDIEPPSVFENLVRISVESLKSRTRSLKMGCDLTWKKRTYTTLIHSKFDDRNLYNLTSCLEATYLPWINSLEFWRAINQKWNLFPRYPTYVIMHVCVSTNIFILIFIYGAISLQSCGFTKKTEFFKVFVEYRNVQFWNQSKIQSNTGFGSQKITSQDWWAYNYWYFWSA